MSFAENLRILRESYGINQADFAALTGIGRQATYSRLELGKSEPRLHQLAGIAKVLGLTIDQLASDSLLSPAEWPAAMQFRIATVRCVSAVGEVEQALERLRQRREELRELLAADPHGAESAGVCLCTQWAKSRTADMPELPACPTHPDGNGDDGGFGNGYMEAQP